MKSSVRRNKKCYCFSFCCYGFFKSRRINTSFKAKTVFLSDPDPNLLYTKGKFTKQGASCAVVDCNSVEVCKQN